MYELYCADSAFTAALVLLAMAMAFTTPACMQVWLAFYCKALNQNLSMLFMAGP